MEERRRRSGGGGRWRWTRTRKRRRTWRRWRKERENRPPAATLLPLISSEGDREEVGGLPVHRRKEEDITTEEVDNAMEEGRRCTQKRTTSKE